MKVNFYSERAGRNQELEDSQPPFVVRLSHQPVAAPLQHQIDHRMSVAGCWELDDRGSYADRATS